MSDDISMPSTEIPQPTQSRGMSDTQLVELKSTVSTLVKQQVNNDQHIEQLFSKSNTVGVNLAKVEQGIKHLNEKIETVLQQQMANGITVAKELGQMSKSYTDLTQAMYHLKTLENNLEKTDGTVEKLREKMDVEIKRIDGDIDKVDKRLALMKQEFDLGFTGLKNAQKDHSEVTTAAIAKHEQSNLVEFASIRIAIEDFNKLKYGIYGMCGVTGILAIVVAVLTIMMWIKGDTVPIPNATSVIQVQPK